MKKCIFCGNEVEEDTTFCPECGRRIKEEKQPQHQEYVQSSAQVDYQQGNQNNQSYFNVQPQPQPKPSTDKIFALVPYVCGILGSILAVLAAKDSQFVMFHVKQALKNDVVLSITTLIVALLAWTFVVPIAGGIFIIVLLVVKFIAFVGACKGQMNEMPIISKFDFLN